MFGPTFLDVKIALRLELKLKPSKIKLKLFLEIIIFILVSNRYLKIHSNKTETISYKN
jgi:hypothetical protein